MYGGVFNGAACTLYTSYLHTYKSTLRQPLTTEYEPSYMGKMNVNKFILRRNILMSFVLMSSQLWPDEFRHLQCLILALVIYFTTEKFGVKTDHRVVIRPSLQHFIHILFFLLEYKTVTRLDIVKCLSYPYTPWPVSLPNGAMALAIVLLESIRVHVRGNTQKCQFSSGSWVPASFGTFCGDVTAMSTQAYADCRDGRQAARE